MFAGLGSDKRGWAGHRRVLRRPAARISGFPILARDVLGL